jgi:hypothetical protein
MSMLNSAKDFFDNLSDDIAEEFDEAKEKIVEILFEKLPALIDKWDFNSRGLAPHEISAAQPIFGENFDYESIRIFEGTDLPNFLDDIGNIIKGMPKRDERIKNAITLGNWCLFGRNLDTEHPHDMSWMVHELTHVWQYQTMGWDYLFQAFSAQKKMGANAYDFGGENGLKEHKKKGGGLKDLNLEQQGDIAKNYYLRLMRKEDTGAWDDYIREIKGENPSKAKKVSDGIK